MIALLFLSACAEPSAREATPVQAPPAEAPPPPVGPHRIPVRFPDGFGVYPVTIDPGHGAPGNTGNTSVFCESEADFTLRVARALRDQLVATGHFDVAMSRDGALVDYDDRIRAANRHGGPIVSLHSDVRAGITSWSPQPGLSCPRWDASEGAAVLWSDEGADQAAGRRALGVAMARRLGEAGFTLYDGGDYPGFYDPTIDAPGLFVDRHVPGKRIRMLRRPRVPVVIVETHQAISLAEATLWTLPETLAAFGDAVAMALVDGVGAKPGRGDGTSVMPEGELPAR